MALKDIFTMIKADRYTADGCEEIKKAQEAIKEETADAGLPDGTMRHRKDGDYIKQAGKWVPAKKGNGGAKKPEEKRKFDQRKYGTSPAAKEDAIRASIVERMTPEQREAVMNGRTLRTVKEGQGVIDITKEDLEFFDKHNAERKPTESKPAEPKKGLVWSPNTSVSEKFNDIINLGAKSEDRTKGPGKYIGSKVQENFVKKALRDHLGATEESIDDLLEGMNKETLKKAYNGFLENYSTDSAPRELTGDCKIRIRKETTDGGLPDGSVSHRKDGDYIKQGGKWKPAPKGGAGKSKSNKTESTPSKKAGSKPAATSWNDAKYGLVNKAGVPLDITSVTFSMTPAWARSHGFSPDDVNGYEAQRKTASKIIRNQDWSNPEEAVKKINEMDFGYNNWRVTEKQADKVKIESKDRLGNLHILTVKRPEATPPASTEIKPAEAPKFKSRNTIMLEKKGFKEVEKGGAYPKLHRFEYKSKSGKTYNVYRDIGSDGFFYHVQTPGGFTKKMSDVGEIKKYLDSDGGNWGHGPGPRGLVSRPYTEKDLVKSNNDAAPRQLTGDCKVRIKKS